jgi:histidyl-tRNA synthetase
LLAQERTLLWGIFLGCGVCAVQSQNLYTSGKVTSRDFYRLNQELYEHMRSYGYELIDLPIIEPADLFLIKAGDQIVDKLFTFEHRGAELALRPEFTASAAYHYAAQYPHNSPTARWQFCGYIFKDDPFDVESKQQQFSIGAELIGMSGVLADAEIIGMAAVGLSKQNIVDYQITLGHIGLLRSALAHFQLDYRTEHFLLSHLSDLKNPSLGRAFVVEQIEKLFLYAPLIHNTSVSTGEAEGDIRQVFDLMLETTENDSPVGGRTRQDISRRLFQKYRRSLERSQIIAAIDFLIDWGQIIGTPEDAFAAIKALIPTDDEVSQQLLMEWRILIDLLDIYGISTRQMSIEPGLVRSWDYYSGTIFELSTRQGAHLGGGGRYDELGKLLGGKQSVSAVGFAYYVDELAKTGSTDKQIRQKDFVVIADRPSQYVAVRWANLLRQHDFDIQLLLEDSSNRPKNEYLYAQADGTMRFQDQTYTFETVDTLTNELKRTQQ